MDKNILESLAQAYQDIKNENQNRPNSYVVVYKRQDNDEIIGYHASTFCQTTKDIFSAKRYSGDKYEEQLSIIWNNFTSLMTKKTDLDMFEKLKNSIREECFPDLKLEQVYIDALYLVDGTPAEEIQVTVAE